LSCYKVYSLGTWHFSHFYTCPQMLDKEESGRQ
jgi:hypothetical protein